MSKAETMRQSADAANAQSLTERARKCLRDAESLLEQVKKRAEPLTVEDLESRIEPMLAALVALAQMDLAQLEQATEHAGKVAQDAASLRRDLTTASSRAEEAATAWRGSMWEHAGWLMALSALAGLIGALLIVGFLLWGDGLKPPAVYLDCQKVQQELQRQAPSLPRR